MNRNISFNHILDLDMLSENPVIIDAGANIGGYIDVLKKLNINPKIIALECSRTNFVKLTEGSYNDVKLLNVALGGENGTATFSEFIGKPKGDGTNKYHKWGNISGNFEQVLKDKSTINRYEVNVVTVERVIRENNLNYVDFLKMDIEGAEYEVIHNMSQETADKIKQISMETHNPKKNKNLIKKLKEFGYEVEEHKGLEIYAYKV